ncbi:MAG: DNA methyltransferase [Mycoplasmoidaceae bacterium]
MGKKDILIEQIKKFDDKYFNEDQKKIAVNILENCPEKEAQSYADFLFNKRKTGFAFDYSPEIARGRIITLREDKGRRINVDDNILSDENKLIIGDNYNALKSLQITHKEKIDVIYIDPPYNTEKAKNEGNNDSYKDGSPSKFYYKDKFGRTGWLTMMKDRLTLAKELLKDDGIIFISIDDTEQAYLKILMDEIFGEENFIANLIIDKRNAQNDAKKFEKNHEYILTYQKSDNFKINVLYENNPNLGKTYSLTIGATGGVISR